jgi:hypothetical protein
MSCQALDELKQQIPLLDYLQAHDWRPARPLSRGRWMGRCPVHSDHKPSLLVDPRWKAISTAAASRLRRRLTGFCRAPRAACTPGSKSDAARK